MNFIFDLDGTLCFDGHTISDEIKDTIVKAERYGHTISFATARSYRDSINVLGEKLTKHLTICLNGGLVYHNGKLMIEHHLPKEIPVFIDKWCQKHVIPYFIDDYFNYATYRSHQIPFIKTVDPLNLAKKLSLTSLENPIKCVLNFNQKEDLLPLFLQEIKQFPKTDIVYHENETCLYINPYQITKAKTILEVIKQPYIAFGNDKNDISMFQNAHYSVQIGNYEDLKPYANKQITNQDSISNVINNLFEEYQ